MRSKTHLAAWIILVGLAAGAAAPKQAADKPATQPNAIRDRLEKDVKTGMTEAEARAALVKAGVKIVEETEKGTVKFLALEDYRRIALMGGKVHTIIKDYLAEEKAKAATQPATKPAK